ncbi:MAG: ATP-binding cassette domain-containing protein [Planctomycetaceae bacterium]|nr:ATP-binding cassette domain-containing protein [Planctomycetaceae bacterium]
MMENQHPLIDLRGVGWQAEGRAILSGVDWRIERGQHWAVIGPNGAGKTTLLKLICGYLWPNAGGEILRGGQPLLDLQKFRCGIGWVSAALAEQIPPAQTALRTVLSGRLAQTRLWPACSDGQALGQARSHLEEIGCGSLADQAFGTLSQGERQRVLIARCRMARPEALILDEPCAGLDAGGRELLLATIQDLARRIEDMVLIYVTHHVEEIMPVFEHTLALAGGKVLRRGPTDAILNAELIKGLYGLDVSLHRRGGRYWMICP